MLVATEDRKQMISRLLTQAPGALADSGALTEQTLWLWERISFHLSPLVGVSGFQSLYGRAIHLASPLCPGFSATARGLPTDALFQSLQRDLAALEPGDAERCANVLLNTFTDLVETMIGEQLMALILRAAWVKPSDWHI